MAVTIEISKEVLSMFNALPEKDRRVVKEHLTRLSDYPDIHGDIKPLRGGQGVVTYRMHIARRYTAFFRVYPQEGVVRVLMLMTIEQAHKRYGEFLKE